MESLSDMVKQGNTEQTVPEIEVESTKEVLPIQTVSVTDLSSWFSRYHSVFPNIRKPTVSIRGVDPNKQLIITVASDEDEENRKLVVLDDADATPVLDLKPVEMAIFRNGFRIIYDNINDIVIKGYSSRTGFISTLCFQIEDVVIPFQIVKAHKSDAAITFEIDQKRKEQIQAKLQQQLDKEALVLLYKQSKKEVKDLDTNYDAVKWLQNRQNSVRDLYHHLQIENVIIELLSQP